MNKFSFKLMRTVKYHLEHYTGCYIVYIIIHIFHVSFAFQLKVPLNKVKYSLKNALFLSQLFYLFVFFLSFEEYKSKASSFS